MIKKKLNCVLLIDDDEPTNFYNEMLIKQAGFAEKVVAVQSGLEALDYLKSKEDGEHPRPDLIFLDINMPAMNGWEFLEEYKRLDKSQKGRIVVVMLTTSLNPDDKMRSEGIQEITDFMNKPLTKEMLKATLEKYFSEWMLEVH